MLVRSWNVYHGNAFPPERRDFLAEMVALASADRPDVLCLQELPAWSLPRLGRWSGMTPITDVANRPLVPALLARTVTDLHHGFFRSALTGQAQAILLASGLKVTDRAVGEIEPSEHRICQAVALEGEIVVGNLHASGRRRPTADSELARALAVVDGLAGRATILAGDFNLRPELPGFSSPGPGIDHVLVRGASSSPVQIWPVARRTRGGRVLSDHAPVEVRVDL